MKQPDEIGGYPLKLCKFIVETATHFVGTEMKGSSGADMALSIKLIVSMCLHCWDAALGKEEISVPPSEEKTKIVNDILMKVSGGSVIQILDEGEVGPALGKLLGDEEAGKNLADILKSVIQKKIQKDDMPKWDPHAE